MSLHYLNGIMTQNQLIQKINKNAFQKGIKQLRKPEFKTPFTMYQYDVNDILLYPTKKTKKTQINGWFDDALTNVTNTLQTAATNVATTLSTGVQNVVTTTQQAVQNVVSTVQQAGANALQSVQSAISNGLSNLSLPQINLTKLNNIWSKIQASVGTYGKKIALAPVRQAFISAVSYNLNNLGTYMAQGWNKDKSKLINWWSNELGGDINVLKKAIAKGSKTTINGNYMGADAEAVLKIVGVALPLIAAVIGILKSIGINIKKNDSDAISKTVPVEPTPTSPTTTQVEIVPTDTIEEQGNNKTLLYVGIGGAVLLGGYLLMRNK